MNNNKTKAATTSPEASSEVVIVDEHYEKIPPESRRLNLDAPPITIKRAPAIGSGKTCVCPQIRKAEKAAHNDGITAFLHNGKLFRIDDYIKAMIAEGHSMNHCCPELRNEELDVATSNSFITIGLDPENKRTHDYSFTISHQDVLVNLVDSLYGSKES